MISKTWTFSSDREIEVKSFPNRRYGYNQKCKILDMDGPRTLYIKTGEYPKGVLKEVRVDIDREGTLARSMINNFCIMLNIALQNNIPLESFGDEFIFTKFPPFGSVRGHKYIKMCSSPLDLIFRDLLITYCNREDLKHDPK